MKQASPETKPLRPESLKITHEFRRSLILYINWKRSGIWFKTAEKDHEEHASETVVKRSNRVTSIPARRMEREQVLQGHPQ